jgi:hypothetical protein
MVQMRTAMLVRAVVHVQTGRRSTGRDRPHFSGPEMLTHDHAPRGHSSGNSSAYVGIPAFPAVSLEADPSTPPRRPGALVTFRQDLLITVRAVITTVRLRLGLVDGTVVRVRLSRWYFVLCKYLVTCDVRAWQLNSKVSAPFGH